MENKNDKVVNIKTKKKEQPSPLVNILDGVSDILPEMGDTEAFAAVIALPDKEFKLMSRLILEELEKALNNTDDEIMLAAAFNSSGLKMEDLVTLYDELSKSIDSELKDIIDEPRRDFLKRMLSLIINAAIKTQGIGKRYIRVPIELLHENAQLPQYQNAGDAGMDVYAIEDFTIEPGETVKINTGLAMAIPLGYELQVRPRSGLSMKTKMRIANSPGTIDANYRDEIGVLIDNIEPKIKDLELEPVFEEGNGIPVRYDVKSVEYGRPFMVAKGERFAQLVLTPIEIAVLFKVEDVKEIGEDRGGGFGSTDSKDEKGEEDGEL